MIIKDNMANMCAKVTSTYMEFTLAFGPKPEFSFSFKYYHFSSNMFFLYYNTILLQEQVFSFLSTKIFWVFMRFMGYL